MEPGPSLRNEKRKISNTIPNVRNVLQSIWVRRYTDHVNEDNRIVFRSQFGFVLACGVLFWTLFFIFGN